LQTTDIAALPAMKPQEAKFRGLNLIAEERTSSHLN
jgi:hypothetical protein